MTSTDSFVGGKSKAEIKLVRRRGRREQGGTADHRHGRGSPAAALGRRFFSPGSAMMAPANLSSKKAIAFKARGDGKTYQVMLFSGSFAAPRPARPSRPAHWEDHRIPLADFDGADGSGLMGVFFGGSDEAGPFELYIDDVRFE